MDRLAVTPTFMNFLKHLSSDQRRIMVTILVKNGQLKALNQILAEESPTAQKEYRRWKEEEEDNKRCYNQADTMASLSPAVACLSDSEDDDDPGSKPGKWAPKIREDFFEDFPEEMNILILGESGVGKSTFINALANYLKFDNMHQAIDHVEVLIRTSFTCMDQENNQIKIECQPHAQKSKEEDNEKVGVGLSTTQAPKSYVITYGIQGRKKKIRIIDTPGIGDDSGMAPEKKNFSKIFSFISQYRKLHAICILMKSNECRMTLNFRYCLNELFTHLHISARQNILFCFTNSRQTMYQPGEILPPLQAYLKTLADKAAKASQIVEFPLNPSTMFCLDNESFRFLCAYREGANISNEMADNNKSWKMSVKETFRLFKQIAQLPAHKIADTIVVSDIRNIILILAKPAAEFSQKQLLNVQFINKKIKEIEDCIEYGKDLNGKLCIEQIEHVPQELSQPVTVCTSKTCVEYKRMGSGPNARIETVYKTVCHSPCQLEGVQTELRPNPALRNCSIFQTPFTNNCCIRCGCGWEEHIHHRYKLDIVVKKVLDPVVEKKLKSCESQREVAELYLDRQNKRKEEIEKASNVAMTRSAEFSAYLRENCIMAYNDAYMEYMDQLIADATKVVLAGGSDDHLNVLEANKEKYIKHVDNIENQRIYDEVPKTTEEMQTLIADFRHSRDFAPMLRGAQGLQLINHQRRGTNKDVEIQTNDGWFGKKFNSS